MKKHILIILLPIVFQANIYCENLLTPTIITSAENNIDRNAHSALKIARYAMKNPNIPLTLDAILSELIIFAQHNKNTYILAISQIKNINDSLQTYKSQQYSNAWSRWFGSTPEIVKSEINPAIKKIDNAYKSIIETNNNVFKYYKTDMQKIAFENARLVASEGARLL